MEKIFHLRGFILLAVMGFGACGGSGGGSANIVVTGQIEATNSTIQTGLPLKEDAQALTCPYSCSTTISKSDATVVETVATNINLNCDASKNIPAQTVQIAETDVGCDALANGGTVSVTCTPQGNLLQQLVYLTGQNGLNLQNCDTQDLNVSMKGTVLGVATSDIQAIVDVLVLSSCPSVQFIQNSFCIPAPTTPSTFCDAVAQALVVLKC